MDVRQINAALSAGASQMRGLMPHLDELERRNTIFRIDFGLDQLPREPGFIAVRGARQFGKSTWLEQQLRDTVKAEGPGTAYYLNGDEISSADDLLAAIRELLPLYRKGAPLRRLFIDEITAVAGWERAIKRLADAGETRQVLIVTTGSRATDVRRGIERLPGRKGRLERTSYLFLPIAFREFRRVCGERLGGNLVNAYLISGGSPVACAELAAGGRLPQYVIELVRDWIYGECAASRRERGSLLAVLEVLLRQGGSPIAQAKLARDAGLANNTVAAGYVELLLDLLCVAPAYAWDRCKQVMVRRRPHKLHFINLLAATAWHPAKMRSVEDFCNLAPAEQGRWTEWLVAQELWRRAAKAGKESPEQMGYWQSDAHEIDFVLGPREFVEVQRGAAKPFEFTWLANTLGPVKLTVVNTESFATDTIRGVPLEEWLAEEA